MPLSSSTVQHISLATRSRVSMGLCCNLSLIASGITAVISGSGGMALAESPFIADSPSKLRFGSLGLGLEAADFGGRARFNLDRNRVDRNQIDRSRQLPSRPQPSVVKPSGTAQFDPSSVRPRLQQAGVPFEAFESSRDRGGLPRLRDSLPLLASSLLDGYLRDGSANDASAIGGALAPAGGERLESGSGVGRGDLGTFGADAAGLPMPMVGPPVGVRPHPLTRSVR